MIPRILRGGAVRLLSTEAVAQQSEEFSSERKLKKIGRALETYLRQSNENVALMKKERAEFELGKRHLANMMSLDPNILTQNDIDEAIKYLFPSGLHDPNARPVMRSPDEILPKFHKFSFDDEGRPIGSRFFTLSPNFYSLLSEIGVKTAGVNRYYSERAFSKTSESTEYQSFNTTGTQWLSEEKMKKKLGEKFSSEMYMQLILALDHLANLPASHIETEFINEYRDPLTSSTKSNLFGPQIPEVEVDKGTNRRIARVRTHIKDTNVEVFVTDAGTGKFDINGQALHEFRHLLAREILLAPMIIANLLGRVDVTATSKGSGGMTALPRAVRHGASLCIAALYPEKMEVLRLAGLLTLDPRKKERSKVNQPGARAKWIWKRR